MRWLTSHATVLLVAMLLAASSAHATVISVPTSGSWSYELLGAYWATGTNSVDGFHFDTRASTEVEYITGTYNFAGFDTLDFTVKGRVVSGHIFWQLMSGSDVLTTGTDGGVINVNQLALPFTDPAVSLLLVSSAFGAEFAVDLHAYSTAVAPVPAPATLPLFATGLGLMALFARRRDRSAITRQQGVGFGRSSTVSGRRCIMVLEKSSLLRESDICHASRLLVCS